MADIRDQFKLRAPSPGAFGVSRIADTEQKAVTIAPRSIFYTGGGAFDWGSGLDLTNGSGDVAGQKAYAAAALAYICIRYRATKLREAPLMVVNETQDGEEWIEDHDLNALLARPNPDFGAKRLIEAVETFLCTTGRVLLVKNRGRGGRVESLYPFSGDDFTVERTTGRLFGRFKIGTTTVDPADAIYLSYFSPTDPLGAVAPLEVALAHLNIGQALVTRVRAHIKNAAAPGGIYVADKEWTPNDEEFERAKMELNTALQGGNTGKTAMALGGGKLEKGWSLSELAMGEVWREVEATVCGIFGVPASLVGTVVGLENSPWSHMSTAHAAFYDTTVLPEWDMIAEALTDGLLREIDTNPAHLVRFYTGKVKALQKDQSVQAVIAAAVAPFTSVNERRGMIGLDRSDEEGADDIPELKPPPAPPAMPNPDDTDEAEDIADEKGARAAIQRKAHETARFMVTDDLQLRQEAVMELVVASLLDADSRRLEDIVASGGEAKETAPKRVPPRILTAIEAYLDGESQDSWKAATRSILMQTADAAVYATVVPDTGIAYRLLRPHLGSYVERRAAFLITAVSDTTKDAVRKALTEAFAEGEGPATAARRIRGVAEFSRTRAKLIARTETTATLTGAPMEALSQYAQTTGSKFVKRWLATMDDRVRDEHAALHGEEVPVDGAFSNGLTHPSEPNCRCGLTYGVAR